MADPKKESTLEKVRKLINQASSPYRQEAESAAYRACALIRQYGLDVVDPAEIDAVYEQQAQLEKKVQQLELQPAKSGRRVRDAGLGYIDPDPIAFASMVDPYGSFTSVPVRPAMTRPVTITSQFRGNCKQCGKAYDVGEQIQWMRGVPKGVWCDSDCYTQWEWAQTTPVSGPGSGQSLRQAVVDMSAALDQDVLDALFGTGKKDKK